LWSFYLQSWLLKELIASENEPFRQKLAKKQQLISRLRPAGDGAVFFCLYFTPASFAGFL